MTNFVSFEFPPAILSTVCLEIAGGETLARCFCSGTTYSKYPIIIVIGTELELGLRERVFGYIRIVLLLWM